MAGIGFELRKILDRDSYLSELTAYLYAAMISSGPWLMSVICLSILGLFRGPGFTVLRHEVFRSTIIYNYCFSLILVGVIQLVLTRYLADRIYEGRERATLSAFSTSLLMVYLTAIPIGIAIYWRFEVGPFYKLCAVLLFLVICSIWLAMIALSAVKDYLHIVYAFATGTACSIAGAMVLYPPFGLTGYLIGYTLGQCVIFFWILARLLSEFPPENVIDVQLVRYMAKYWDLAAIGFGFNLAIWIDKMVFWFAPDSRVIFPWFRTHDFYEGPIFFAYLSIVPTMAIFLMKIETRFYEHYRDYYAKIMAHKSLKLILMEKKGMIEMLRESMREVFIIQGAITLLCLVFAPALVDLAQLMPMQVPLLRVGLIGAFLQVLLSMAVIVLFYFDQRRKVLVVTAVFLLGNGILSWISTLWGFQYYGYGYCYSCLMALITAFYLLQKTVDDLEFITFAEQPIA